MSVVVGSTSHVNMALLTEGGTSHRGFYKHDPPSGGLTRLLVAIAMMPSNFLSLQQRANDYNQTDGKRMGK